MTTKECLHRFCSDCIITALRSGNKECPTCRKKLVSKRSLRPDPNFDYLISVSGAKSHQFVNSVNHKIPRTRRKSTPVATNTKRIRRKFSPNSTKATHSKPSSTPSQRASSFNLRIVHRESAKAKRIRAKLQTVKQRAIHRPTAKASRHVNHRIHRQLAVHHRPFHRTQAPPARLQRSAHAPS